MFYEYSRGVDPVLLSSIWGEQSGINLFLKTEAFWNIDIVINRILYRLEYGIYQGKGGPRGRLCSFFLLSVLLSEILQNIDIDKILYRLEYGMSKG